MVRIGQRPQVSPLAARVTAILDKSCMVARLGGDEFAILVPGLSNPAAAGKLADTLLDALRPDDDKSDSDNMTSCSIGIAICPDDADSRETLLNHADTALYRAKMEGRATYRFFEAKMAAEVHDRRVLEHDLRQAVSRGEFSLVYQPQGDIQTGSVVGFEALLRAMKGAEKALITDAVLHPSFPEPEVKKVLSQRIDAARALKDDPQPAAGVYFRAFFYGAAHPYGRPADELTLARITRDSIIDYHRRMYTAKNMTVVAVGDFAEPAMAAKLSSAFSAVSGGSTYFWASAPPPSRSTSPRLLLVDDESSITDGLAPFLARSGFEVRVAPDGQQAWDLIARWQPDIVVSDVMMPVMDGRELVRRLRASGDGTPTILLTRVGESGERSAALEEGADDYLNKPFDPQELVRG